MDMANPRVLIETTKGSITVELFPEQAPKTVENFLGYVRSGHYTGTLFHRVIQKFMIQGGGYDVARREKATRPPIANEAANGLKNRRGTLAMARTSEPHSATAQFFINLVDNDFLDHTAPTPEGFGYCVFGQVVEGMDVVDAVADGEDGGAVVEGAGARHHRPPIKGRKQELSSPAPE
jgi:cyclophilin family peptidyl-prolyl cis-trans isomerase